MSTFVLHDAELDGERVDVLVAGAVVAAIEPVGSLRGAQIERDCAGGAVLPGLHDHHIHLLAMAAARQSVDVTTGFDAAIRDAHARVAPGAWLRAVGYDESRDGRLDRARLDALAPARSVRVQHRSGAMWVLSSAALRVVGAADASEVGVERDDGGQPTGRLFQLDGWLRDRVPQDSPLDLAAVGAELASYGVTGATDCTATSAAADFATIAEAVHNGSLALTVAVTGGASLAEAVPPRPLRRGPVKLVLADHELPPLDQVVDWIGRAHAADRPVAVHCVTREAVVLAVAAWHDAGAVAGDRIEHASITPVELIAELAALGIAVVTQPAFVSARGDAYLRDVEPVDVPDLYRCASLRAGGVEVGGSTDAPYGPADPWVAVRAATDRRSASGAVVGSDEALSAAVALSLFLAPLDRPGGPPRRVEPGAPADVCVLDRPLPDALAAPSSAMVMATIAGGEHTYSA